MPKVAVLDMAGKEVSSMELSDAIFGIKPNESVMHQMVVNYLANQRQGTQSTLTRTEVRGGGTRAPQWTHGGIALGPKPRDYSYSLNKKVKRLAMKSALSTKVLDNNMMIIEKIELEDFKTKAIIDMLTACNAGKKALIVMPAVDQKVIKSAANIPGVKTALVNTLNVYDILHYDTFIVAKDAIAKLEEVYA